jgi:hypothetical protein
MLVKDLQVQLVGPPVTIGPPAGRGVRDRAMHDRAFSAAVVSVHLRFPSSCLAGPAGAISMREP